MALILPIKSVTGWMEVYGFYSQSLYRRFDLNDGTIKDLLSEVIKILKVPLKMGHALVSSPNYP